MDAGTPRPSLNHAHDSAASSKPWACGLRYENWRIGNVQRNKRSSMARTEVGAQAFRNTRSAARCRSQPRREKND